MLVLYIYILDINTIVDSIGKYMYTESAVHYEDCESFAIEDTEIQLGEFL